MGGEIIPSVTPRRGSLLLSGSAETRSSDDVIAFSRVHPASGRKMRFTSTEPVCQTYFSTLLQDTPGKDGVMYGTYGGLCLEMQRYADVVLHEVPEDATPERKAYVAAKRDFTLLKPGEKCRPSPFAWMCSRRQPICLDVPGGLFSLSPALCGCVSY